MTPPKRREAAAIVVSSGIPDQVLQIVGFESLSRGHLERMDENESAQCLCGFPDGFQVRVVEVPSLDVGGQVESQESEGTHRPPKLLCGALRRLHRQRRQTQESIRVFPDEGGDLIVLDLGACRAQGRLLVVEEGLGGVREELDVHVGFVHVLKPQVQVPGLTRKGLLCDPGDLQDAGPLVYALELQCQRRRRLLQLSHRLFRKDMGMDVYGLVLVHRSCTSIVVKEKGAPLGTLPPRGSENKTG